MPSISLPVRHLVEFVYRSGGLASGYTGRNRMAEGVRAHRRLQKMRPEGYRAEVPVSFMTGCDGIEIEISGRIDGLLATEDRILIEEIKTVTEPVDPAAPDNLVHWSQAKVYACITALQMQRETIDVQLTYVRLDPWEIVEDRREFETEELARWLRDLLARYLAWAGPYHAWAVRRDESIASLEFPFSAYRPGQRRMAIAVYRAIEAQSRLFVQAPTGIGKTISALFPAIKALRDGHIEKIFYLTAKTIGRVAAEKALDDMRGKGLALKSLIITARDKICFKPAGAATCDQIECPYAMGYFDRINDALTDTFTRYDRFSRDVVEDQAQKHRVCPFELSLDLALWADVVICDYNYVFDPGAYLRRFFMERTGRYAFLIDEAHNLVDRAREMFSASLSKQRSLDLRRTVKPFDRALAGRLSDINDALLPYRKACEEEGEYGRWMDASLPEALLPPLQRFADAVETLLATRRPAPGHEALLDYYFETLAFLRVAEWFDERYVAYAEKFGQEVTLRLFCLDPSRLIREGLSRGAAAVFFSATLTPLTYFRDLLGGERDDPALSLDSPFPSEHLRLLVAERIGTSFRQRDASFDDVAAAIAGVVMAKTGNYLAFFPSYRYMEAVYERFHSAYPHLRVRLQSASMTEPEREAFLSGFDADNPDTLTGFAVMGGLFGEGIDLVGDRLIGAVIVGVGLPQVSFERDLIRGYFGERGVDGFDYAYVYPGINRVLQAAGRVIRAPEERGIVLLIDQRFAQTRYRDLLPSWWKPVTPVRDAEHIAAAAAEFWEA